MKKKPDREHWLPQKIKKGLMKCTLLCTLLLLFVFSAGAIAQKATLRIQAGSLDDVFQEIIRQSDIELVYNADAASRIQCEGAVFEEKEIAEVLGILLEGTPFTYKLENGIYMVTHRVATDMSQQVKGIKVTGTVRDKKGNVLPGVTVMVKGTQMGVATDVDGKYILSIVEGNYTLVFSMVGMKPLEVKVDGRPVIDVELEESINELGDVVVTGYEKIERRHLTSSIVSLKADEVLEVGQISLDNMLQGKVPGLAVMNPSSSPGAAPKIRIRGTSTITGNREPLWVVDGIPLEEPVQVSNAELNSMDRVNFIGNAISFLNPEDIVRVDILKDASATAIYGTRAANGVIVVTTKRGEEGKAKINYSFTANLITRPQYKDMYLMNSAERIEVSEELVEKGINYNGGLPTSVGYERELDRLWKREISYEEFKRNVKALKEMNTDWYDLLFRNGFSNSHNLSVSGGSKRTTYFISAGYSNQKGTAIREDYQRYNVNMKLNTYLHDKLRLDAGLSVGVTENSRPHPSIDLYKYAYQTSRSIAPYDENGDLVFYDKPGRYANAVGTESLDFNIFHELNHSGNVTKNSNTALNLSLDWNAFEWLRYNMLLGVTRSTSRSEQFQGPETYAVSLLRGIHYGEKLPEDEDFIEYTSQLPYGGIFNLSNTYNQSYTFRHSLNFSKQFSENHFGATGGVEIRSSKYEGDSQVEYGYLPDRGKKFVNIQASMWPKYEALVQPLALKENTTNFVSYYGTFTYAWANKYILNANVRADGSNKFGQHKDARFLPIWSFSGRWNITQEGFLKSSNLIRHLSLHGSYGIQGNVHPDQVPSLILNMGTLDELSNQYISTTNKFPNNKLRWEKTRSYNLGIDFDFLGGILSGSVEMYYKKGEDIVIVKDICPTNGADAVALNRGTLQNRGIDFTINSNIVNTNDYSFSLSVNAGKNKNKVIDAGENLKYTYKNYLDGSIIVNDEAINTFYSYRYAGLDKNGLPTFDGIQEKDEAGNYIDSDLESAILRAMEVSGRREPILTGGFSTFFRYRNLRLNALFSFSFGNKIRLNEFYSNFGTYIPGPEMNMSSDFVDRWRKPGDEQHTDVPVLSNNSLRRPYSAKYEVYDSYWQMYDNSDLRVASGNFLKCQNISLSYSLDKKMLQSVGIRDVTVTLSGANLFKVADSKLKGRDPEQVSLGAGAVPPMPNYSLRLSVSF